MSTIRVLPDLGLRLGYLVFDDCTVDENNPAIGAAYAARIETTRARFKDRPLAGDPTIQGVRKLFRALGVDPGRYRPSGEALARRVLKGSFPPRVNSLVDINNLCSLATLYPWGTYDWSRVNGDVVLRLGAPGECYQGIGKPVRIAGKPVSADAAGAFGSPIADSARTRVTAATRSTLVLVYTPADTRPEVLDEALGHYAALAIDEVGARQLARGTLTAGQVANIDARRT